MTDTKYNGWANWATWNMGLWVDNDELLYTLRCEHHLVWTDDSAEEWARAWLPNGTPDMDSAAEFDDVNWQEIADAWNEE